MTIMQEREQAGPGLPLVELVVREEDLGRGSWLRTQLEDVLRVRPERCVVDLARCASLESAALRALLDTHRQLRRQGGVLVLRGLCPRLVRVIGLSGLTDVFDVEERAQW